MKLQLVGCSHHHSSITIREKLAFPENQVEPFLNTFYRKYPQSEAVLLSTCNRTELYVAGNEAELMPSHREMVSLLAEHRRIELSEISQELFALKDRGVIRHLFSVTSSLDSMIIGETQILAQVKKAYQLANEINESLPITHRIFQTAIRVARRVAQDTKIHSSRVSVPSVAVGVFAKQIFERLDNKKILILGAGGMAEETIRYVIAEGGRDITVINRTLEHAERLAGQFQGKTSPWVHLDQQLIAADFVISTTGATEPVITRALFDRIEKARAQRPLLLLDLAVPRDIDPEIGNRLNVYLYTLDDLQRECERNQHSRASWFQKAEMIVEEETDRFLIEMSQRGSGEAIIQLKQQADDVKIAELRRLFNKLDLDDRQRQEIEQSFNRLVNKILHPPLQSIRDEEEHHGLVDALKRLFQLK